jgi:hypothetical protein
MMYLMLISDPFILSIQLILCLIDNKLIFDNFKNYYIYNYILIDIV